MDIIFLIDKTCQNGTIPLSNHKVTQHVYKKHHPTLALDRGGCTIFLRQPHRNQERTDEVS